MAAAAIASFISTVLATCRNTVLQKQEPEILPPPHKKIRSGADDEESDSEITILGRKMTDKESDRYNQQNEESEGFNVEDFPNVLAFGLIKPASLNGMWKEEFEYLPQLQYKNTTMRISDKMSGAQGAQPMGSFTATTYESVGGGENKTRTDLKSKEDEGGIEIDKLQDKVEDAAGKGGPVFGAGAAGDDMHDVTDVGKKPDLGVSGTG